MGKGVYFRHFYTATKCCICIAAGLCEQCSPLRRREGPTGGVAVAGGGIAGRGDLALDLAAVQVRTVHLRGGLGSFSSRGKLNVGKSTGLAGLLVIS